MVEKILIASGNHNVFREGNRTVKVFRKDFPKSEVLREALHMALVEGTGLKVPQLRSVEVMEDGCWAIVYDYIEGKTLMQHLEEEPDKMEAYMDQMLDCSWRCSARRFPSQQSEGQDETADPGAGLHQ